MSGLEKKQDLHPRSLQPLRRKLFIPAIRPNLVKRLRLTDQLQNALLYRLVLLVAPAGYGKTTLLSQWANESSLPVAWLSLDIRDNDPLRFWTHFIGAFQTLYPRVGVQTLQSLQFSQTLQAEAIVESLINDFVTQSLPLTLILDDYHLIKSQSIHDAIDLLLEHAVQQLHFVIATRHAPALALARLRARGHMLELSAVDLRFKPDEARIFLEQTAGLKLRPEEVSILESRTEGWIAGLQLAALALQKKPNPLQFIEAFNYGHRLILNYLADEVLKRQPEHIQVFLTQTSILDRMNASLCDAVTGRQGSDELLKRLVRDNLFVMPLNGKGHWYRYHELFRDLLQNHLEELQPELASVLHRKASDWFEKQSLVEEAVQHALRAKDFENAVRLLGHVVNTYLERSNVREVLTWLNMLPEEFVRSDPRICLLFGSALVLNGRFSEGEPLLETVENVIAEKVLPSVPDLRSNGNRNAKHVSQVGIVIQDEGDVISAWIDIFRAFMMCFRNSHEAIFLSQQVLDRIPIGERGIHSRALLNLGHANLLNGNSSLADQVLTEASAICYAQDQISAYLSAVHYLAQLRILQGRLREAKVLYHEAILKIEPEEPVYAGLNYIGLGYLLCETNHLADARRYLEKGLEAAEEGGNFVFISDGYIALSRLEQAMGNVEEALCLLQKAEDLFQLGRMTSALIRNKALKARLWLSQGNLMVVEQWAKSCGLSTTDPLNYSNSTAFMTLIQFQIAEKKFDTADILLERYLREAKAQGWKGSVIGFLALKAINLDVQGKSSQALDILNEALSLAEPEHYIRTFVEFGRSMAELLLQLRSSQRKGRARLLRPLSHKYINEVIAAFSMDQVEPTGTSLSSTSSRFAMQPLSKREIQILHLVATGLRNLDIARELIISAGTVRRHMHNICNKLDARNRSEAVAHARSMNLL